MCEDVPPGRARPLTLAVDDVDEDVDDDDGARPADACAVGASDWCQTHTTSLFFLHRLVQNAV